MKIYNLLTATFLTLAMNSCKDENPNEKYFSFDETKLKNKYNTTDTPTLEITNPLNKAIDSIAYYVNDKRIASVKGAGKADFQLKDAKFGYQALKAIVFYDGETSGQEITGRMEVVSNVEPKLFKFTVVNTYPHDVNSFTEGLEFYRDTLLESTGQKRSSYFRKLDYKTGKVFKQVDLTPEYFGEGITIINNKIYQLTWQEKTGFIYDANTLKKVKEFTFDKPVEGWGMTNDGKYIYHSDGTEKIWRMDPETQKLLDYINVYSISGKIKSVNELEFVNGKIYGNIWQKDSIAIINPLTGAVEGIINLATLRKELKNPNAEVLNGIAYNKKTGTLFVTGKNWDKLFEIRISE